MHAGAGRFKSGVRAVDRAPGLCYRRVMKRGGIMRVLLVLAMSFALAAPALAARRVPKTTGYHGLGCRYGACSIHHVRRWHH
jgi:hypothetical protein